MLITSFKNGIITLPIAVFGFLWFPNTPEKSKAKSLSPEERQLAVSRLPPIAEDGYNIMLLSLNKRVFLHPTLYVQFLKLYDVPEF